MSEKDNAQTKIEEIPLKAGDRFRHYKTEGIYEIVTLAIKEDTLEPLVVYKSLERGGIWVRTYENFTEDVDANSQSVKRFIAI